MPLHMLGAPLYVYESTFWTPFGFLKTYLLVAQISSDYFESCSSLSNIWIDQPLMPSSDITTIRKPGSDFDWLIV